MQFEEIPAETNARYFLDMPPRTRSELAGDHFKVSGTREVLAESVVPKSKYGLRRYLASGHRLAVPAMLRKSRPALREWPVFI
jgi:hypothetical protein